jgi:signal transduction histidine kinase
VELHGGQLQMEQREGSRTVFGFGLPIHSGAAQGTSVEPQWHQEVA